MDMVESKQIEVESYSNIAFDGAWKSRSRAIWGIAFLGLLAGAAVGLAAPFFPVIAGVAEGVSIVTAMNSMAVFGATGMATGLLAGGLVGSSAGAASSVAKEMELRERLHEQEVGKALGVNIPANSYKKPAEPEQNMLNPKVGLLFATLGAVAGKIMAVGFLATSTAGAGGTVVSSALGSAAIPALEVILGGAAATPLAVTACFVGVMACFGAMFGVNFPKIGGYLQDFAGKLLSGEKIGASWEKEPQLEQQISMQPTLAKQPKANTIDFSPYHDSELPSNHAEKYAKKHAISYGELAESLKLDAKSVHSH